MFQTALNNVRRHLKIAYRLVTKPKIFSLDGIKVEADRRILPRGIVRRLWKERHEQEECKMVKEAVQLGDRVLELGAGIGLVSLICARAAGPENLLSYEANPKLVSIIKRNFELNGWQINLRSRAISNEAGEVCFEISDKILGSTLYSTDDSSSITVSADDIREIIAEFQPTVLVVDIEGAEVDVLAVAPLDGVRAIIIELHPSVVGKTKIEALLEHLSGVGFRQTGCDASGTVVRLEK